MKKAKAKLDKMKKEENEEIFKKKRGSAKEAMNQEEPVKVVSN